MTPDQIRLKPAAAKGLGPKGRLQKRRELALHANLMAAVGKSSKAKILAATKKAGRK